MQYPEPSQYGAFHNKSRADWTEKDFDEWGTWRTDLYAYWSWLSKRRFHALPEDKGIPVPGLRKSGRRKYVNGSGVSASSRVLSHYYADEGDKGRWVRKIVRNHERALWQAEWREERWENDNGTDEVTYDTAEWFSSQSLMWDWYENDYDASELYTLDYEASPEFNMPYDFDGYADFCGHCGGPCEL